MFSPPMNEKRLPVVPPTAEEWNSDRLEQLLKRTAALSRACAQELAEMRELRLQVETTRERVAEMRGAPVEAASPAPVRENSAVEPVTPALPRGEGGWVSRLIRSGLPRCRRFGYAVLSGTFTLGRSARNHFKAAANRTP